jgi:hypothetical protein
VVALCDSVLQPGSTRSSDKWTYCTGQLIRHTFDVQQLVDWWIARTSCEGLVRYSDGRSYQLFNQVRVLRVRTSQSMALADALSSRR